MNAPTPPAALTPDQQNQIQNELDRIAAELDAWRAGTPPQPQPAGSTR